MQIKIKSAFVCIKNLVVKILFKTFHDLTILNEEKYSCQLSIKMHKLIPKSSDRMTKQNDKMK